MAVPIGQPGIADVDVRVARPVAGRAEVPITGLARPELRGRPLDVDRSRELDRQPSTPSRSRTAPRRSRSITGSRVGTRVLVSDNGTGAEQYVGNRANRVPSHA